MKDKIELHGFLGGIYMSIKRQCGVRQYIICYIIYVYGLEKVETPTQCLGEHCQVCQ